MKTFTSVGTNCVRSRGREEWSINLKKLKFYDCNAMVGKRRIKNPGSFYKTDELIRKMEYYGIEKALVRHSLAGEYDPITGNSALTDEIKDRHNLSGVWVILPHQTGEFPNAALLRELLKENRISAVAMLPKDHMYNLDDWVCSELFDMLEETNLPLFINHDQILAYKDLHALLSSRPKLRIILTDLHYNTGRNLYPLLEKFENLFIETIGFKVHSGIEDVCRNFGAGKLIFGTCAPIYSGGAAVAMITYARISDEDKQMIASGNLEKLLGEVCLV